jgi:transposase-like protein
LSAALGRARYDRSAGVAGYRNGHRDRQLLGTFGPVSVSVPRALLAGGDGKPKEWHSKTLPAYKRLTQRAETLIAGAYLAGTNTRRVRRAFAVDQLGGQTRLRDIAVNAAKRLHPGRSDVRVIQTLSHWNLL